MASDVAVIAGAGQGLSASLARLLAKEGFRVVLAARNTAKLAPLIEETGALAVETDVADPASVASLFDAADKAGPLALAVFNASGRTRGPIAELDPDAVKQALSGRRLWRLPGRPAGGAAAAGARLRLDPVHRRHRQPQGISRLGRLCHAEIRPARPGAVHGPRAGAEKHPCRAFHHRRRHPAARTGREPDRPDRRLSPDAIAETYLATHRQHRSAWSFEVELRPWVETSDLLIQSRRRFCTAPVARRLHLCHTLAGVLAVAKSLREYSLLRVEEEMRFFDRKRSIADPVIKASHPAWPI